MPILKSPQREEFAQRVASGLSQADAYRKAYPSSLSWKDDSVHNKASALMRDALVKARVNELRAEIAQKDLWSRIDSVETLKPIAMHADKDSDRIAAVKVLNDMHGYNAPIKTEVSGPNGGPVQIQAVDTSGLSVAEKRALLQLVEKMESSAAANG